MDNVNLELEKFTEKFIGSHVSEIYDDFHCSNDEMFYTISIILWFWRNTMVSNENRQKNSISAIDFQYVALE